MVVIIKIYVYCILHTYQHYLFPETVNAPENLTTTAALLRPRWVHLAVFCSWRETKSSSWMVRVSEPPKMPGWTLFWMSNPLLEMAISFLTNLDLFYKVEFTCSISIYIYISMVRCNPLNPLWGQASLIADSRFEHLCAGRVR